MMTEKFTRPRLGAAKLFTIGGGDEGLGGPLTPIDEKLWTHYIDVESMSSRLEGVEGTEVIVSHVTIPNTSLPKHWHPGEELTTVRP